MVSKHIQVIYFVLLFPFISNAQITLQGKVTDTKNEPLAFVTILLNGNPYEGVTTDIDGLFRIESDNKIKFLKLSYVGYEDLKYTVQEEDFSKSINLVLESKSFLLQEAVVIAGENPAHRIIRNTVANRKRNNPEKLDQFQCKTYNKMVFDFLPNEEGLAQTKKEYAAKGKKRNKLQRRQDTVAMSYIEFAKRQHVAVMETITKKDFLAPNNHQETVLMNRVSGFKNPQFVALAKDAQPFSFYETHLTILGENYLNPISPGSTNAYFFQLKDTLYQAQDSIFIISYQPKKGKTFEGLKGVLYIHTSHFALQNVIAEPADSSVTTMRIEQKYSYLSENDIWFPEQLNFEWIMPKYPAPHVGLKISGKSYISEVQLACSLKRNEFTADKYILTQDANSTADSLWMQERIEQLDPKEKETYIWWDTLKGAKNIERIFNFTESLASGIYPMQKIDIDIRRILDFNDYENTRLGFGLHTNDGFSKWLRLGGYVGFGFGDAAWKYGGDVRFTVNQKREAFLEFAYIKDTRVPGIPQYPGLALNSLFDRGLYDFRMDTYKELSAKVGFTLFKNATFDLKVAQDSWQPNYEYDFIQGGDIIEDTPFEFTEISAGLRYAYGEQLVPFMGSKIPNPTTFPILQIRYTQGIDLFNQGHTAYHKYLVGIEQTFPIRRLGTFSYRVEGGYSSENLPYPKLFSASGVGTGFRIFDFGYTFQTMGQYEFLSDQFVHVFLEHNFGTLSKKSKWSQPELAIVQNIAYGSLRQADFHQGIEFQTLEKGFFETGLILNNLFRINYVNFAYLGFGWATYLRYGDYAFPDLEDNLAYRLTIDFNF